jgi:hypothetical protein
MPARGFAARWPHYPMSKAHRVAEIAQEVACALTALRAARTGCGKQDDQRGNAHDQWQGGGRIWRPSRRSCARRVEIEFSLSNPYPCLEKDAFKVMIARDAGRKIERLVFIGDPGCAKRLAAAAPKTITGWLLKQHGIAVDVIELAKRAARFRRQSAHLSYRRESSR